MSALFNVPEAITVLVECLAVMAFQPGGVKFADLHFDAVRHGWIREETA